MQLIYRTHGHSNPIIFLHHIAPWLVTHKKDYFSIYLNWNKTQKCLQFRWLITTETMKSDGGYLCDKDTKNENNRVWYRQDFHLNVNEISSFSLICGMDGCDNMKYVYDKSPKMIHKVAPVKLINQNGEITKSSEQTNTWKIPYVLSFYFWKLP